MDLCYPLLLNTSCRRTLRTQSQASLLYVLLFVALLTVLLNLLVIVSISHFHQLHTPTNLVLLSLACSDLLVGLLVMPLEAHSFISSCWFLGSWVCNVFIILYLILTSASVGSILLISLDRYVAICQPLHYTSKVTKGRVQLMLGLCWSCSVLCNCIAMQGSLREPGRHSLCHGDCVILLNMTSSVVDLLVTFLTPVSGVIVLYLRVFAAALSQTRKMRSSQVVATAARRSELKAAMTLGVVVVVFLVCFSPSCFMPFTEQHLSTIITTWAWALWLLYLNSFLNPLIYTFFYPWFRKAIRLIVTLQILQPGSSHATIF